MVYEFDNKRLKLGLSASTGSSQIHRRVQVGRTGVLEIFIAHLILSFRRGTSRPARG